MTKTLACLARSEGGREPSAFTRVQETSSNPGYTISNHHEVNVWRA